MNASEAVAVAIGKNLKLPEEVLELIKSAPRSLFFNSPEEIFKQSMGGEDNLSYDVKYDIPGQGEVTEVKLHRVTNGLSANYTDPYMRRRDPDTMLIGDSQPTDKKKFADEYGYDFSILRSETLEWLKGREIGIFYVLPVTTLSEQAVLWSPL
jgi:hypothetical protein